MTERAVSSNEKRSRTIWKVCEVGGGWRVEWGLWREEEIGRVSRRGRGLREFGEIYRMYDGAQERKLCDFVVM